MLDYESNTPHRSGPAGACATSGRVEARIRSNGFDLASVFLWQARDSND